MSHEFRAPLGTSLMFLESVVKTGGLPDSAVDTLNVVIMQQTFLLSLVNCILDIKLIESGKFVENLESFNPLTVLHFIIAMFKP